LDGAIVSFLLIVFWWLVCEFHSCWIVVLLIFIAVGWFVCGFKCFFFFCMALFFCDFHGSGRVFFLLVLTVVGWAVAKFHWFLDGLLLIFTVARWCSCWFSL